jgi:hypothetical protein
MYIAFSEIRVKSCMTRLLPIDDDFDGDGDDDDDDN